MKDKKIKILLHTAQWLVAFTGSIYGLVLAIIGYLSDWGPGGSMNGPFWKVFLSGAISMLAGALIGIFIVRKLARILFDKPFSRLETGLRAFAIVLVGSFPAFVSSWTIGYIMGKLTGTIDGLDWTAVLVYTPLMSFVYSIPVCLATALLFGTFVFIYSKGEDGLSKSGKFFKASAFIVFVLLQSCDYIKQPMSEIIEDNTAGMNGSFEVARLGLPVNWLMYTPKTVPAGNFDIVIDTTEFKDGKQSLKFNVRECVATGGWHSPGFCNQFPAKPGQAYKISFWVKNNGSGFFIQIGGISSSGGQYETIIKSDETIDSWQLVEYIYNVPEKMTAIRFELNIIKPGIFWIDDLKIEHI